MISVYPFASGSVYTASYAISASYADVATYMYYAPSASNAAAVLNPVSGSRGKSVCLLTEAQFNYLYSTGYVETCIFPK